VLAGRPAERILATEKEIAPDVTIIGTHGRHGLDRLMLGSVAERVVRRATGPVLVVPTKA
jgi:nucleotide-binding universal stress UspA family protein